MATKNFKINASMCKTMQYPIQDKEGKTIAIETVTGLQVFGPRSRPITDEVLTDDMAEYIIKKPGFELAIQKVSKKEKETKE